MKKDDDNIWWWLLLFERVEKDGVIDVVYLCLLRLTLWGKKGGKIFLSLNMEKKMPKRVWNKNSGWSVFSVISFFPLSPTSSSISFSPFWQKVFALKHPLSLHLLLHFLQSAPFNPFPFVLFYHLFIHSIPTVTVIDRFDTSPEGLLFRPGNLFYRLTGKWTCTFTSWVLFFIPPPIVDENASENQVLPVKYSWFVSLDRSIDWK